MITEKQFEDISSKREQFTYTSMQYIQYEDVLDYDVICHNEKAIVLYGYNVEGKKKEYHWCSSKLSDLLNVITDNGENSNGSVLITFVPKEWVCSFEESDFQVYAIWNDYVKPNLEDINSESNSDSNQNKNQDINQDISQDINQDKNHDIPSNVTCELLKEADCGEASMVTKACQGQSRGFAGQTKEWMMQWITGKEPAVAENTKNTAVIIHREQGKIVGLVCTATYGHESEKGAVSWIRMVAVKPEYQRKGIARKLIKQALVYGKEHGATRAFLAADECNEHAIHLYESLGFVCKPEECQIDMIKGKL